MANSENNDNNKKDDKIVDNFVSIHKESLLVERRLFKYSLQLYSPDVNPEKNACLKDIIKMNCLPFLPAKSLFRFKAVSKEWNQWITNAFLAYNQTIYFKDISGLLCQSPGLYPKFISFNRSAYGIPNPSLSFLPESVNIRTTCNGLVCCQSCFGDLGYYICNPVTEEWKVLPMPTFCHGPETAVTLAFEPAALDFDANYVLVCAVPVNNNDVSVIFFETYSLRESCWKSYQIMCSEVNFLESNSNGFYMKGIVYWKTLLDAVLAFDLKNEQYGTLPLPASKGRNGTLTQMHGELCYMLPQIQEDGECSIGVYGNMDMSLKYVIPLEPDIVENTISLDHEVDGSIILFERSC